MKESVAEVLIEVRKCYFFSFYYPFIFLWMTSQKECVIHETIF